MSAIQDTAGHLWLATYDQGVWRYDGKKAQQYLVKDGDKTVTLYSVYQDRNGHIWLGTHSSGTYQFNGQSFERFRP